MITWLGVYLKDHYICSRFVMASRGILKNRQSHVKSLKGKHY